MGPPAGKRMDPAPPPGAGPEAPPSHEATHDSGHHVVENFEPPQQREWVLHLTDRLFFTLHQDEAETVSHIRKYPSLFYFSNPLAEMYEPFCLDFGPVNISVLCQFCEDLRARCSDPRLAHRTLVFYGYAGDAHVMANTAFLLSAFLVLDTGISVEDAALKFEGLTLPYFRDATYTEPTYLLTGIEVLRGLSRARELRWVDHLTFDVEKYEDNYDMAIDMVHVLPKFAAFAAPRRAHFAPLVEALVAAGVTDIVKLNSNADYPVEAFVSKGVRVHDLCFDDCTCPAPSVVRRFLDICDKAPGVVGVHCLAGLGRTGTLIACHMIKHYGFTAREAIGYLRLMRPGSVIGRQQHYLELVAMSEWEGNTPVLCGEAESQEGMEVDGLGVGSGEETEKAETVRGASPKGPLETPSTCFYSPEQSRQDAQIASDVAQALRRHRQAGESMSMSGGSSEFHGMLTGSIDHSLSFTESFDQGLALAEGLEQGPDSGA
mmetsp:Transcript_8384/g.19596  ORF Transcript_8384/g.19596 Transcript_8384/m.19596 type:complete len:489 (-) Transcript_8384:170-1636(-)